MSEIFIIKANTVCVSGHRVLENDLDILDVPCVLVFTDGMLKSIYSISDNDYSIDRFIIYLNNV